ncbi:MAG TPA: T9SS type A sorting domain-containing protein [Rhodothermales bacterium]
MSVAWVAALLVGGLFPARVEAQEEPGPQILAHYMPWYQAKPYQSTWGWHWTMDHFNPDAVGVDGGRPIASHYYPSIGPYDSRDPDVLEYHMLLMRVAGIDGIIVDWYGTSNHFDYPMLHIATQAAFETARRFGLSFAICYEDQTVSRLIQVGNLSPGQAIAHAQDQMSYVQEQWMSDPAYARVDGAPLLLTFGPRYFTTSSQWEQIFSALSEDPLFLTLDTRLSPAAEGAFAWPPMSRSINGTLSFGEVGRYLDVFHAYGRTEWASFASAAFPGFNDIYEEAEVGPSYGFLDSRGGLTFSQTLDRAIQSGAPVIQLVTWNDFGEGTNIEPTLEYEFQYLVAVQEAVRELENLSFAAADLELPGKLYALRKAHGSNPDTAATLDAAAAAIAAGDPAEARVLLEAISTSVDDGPAGRANRATIDIFPNPASERASIAVRLADAATVDLAVFDVLGRRVASIASGPHAPGRHTYAWSATDLASGLYLVRMQTGTEFLVRPLVLGAVIR